MCLKILSLILSSQLKLSELKILHLFFILVQMYSDTKYSSFIVWRVNKNENEDESNVYCSCFRIIIFCIAEILICDIPEIPMFLYIYNNTSALNVIEK